MEKIRKHSLIKKILVPIIMLAIFLLPISPNLEKNTVKAEAEAQAAELTPAIITISGTENSGNNLVLSVNVKSRNGETPLSEFRHLYVLLYPIQPDSVSPSETSKHIEEEHKDVNSDDKNISQDFIFEFSDLVDGQRYFSYIFLTDGYYNPDGKWFTSSDNYSEVKKFVETAPLPWKTGYFDYKKNTQTEITETGSNSNVSLDFDCGVIGKGTVKGCVADFLYNVLFTLAAKSAELVAKILDWVIYYSVTGSSYTQGFISKAWGTVRDVANIFFIIALLYVGLKLILDLPGGSSPKKLISYIIIIALLINFSLFFSQVIIDSSNILARIFYNPLTPVDSNGKELAENEGGHKSVSVGLVSKFDPQTIVGDQDTIKENMNQFIFITVISILLMCFMIYIFMTCALLFIGRVVTLWMCMVFSPLAFASYTLPFDIPGFGHKTWWEQLIKACFLAPVFIFFLYIIFLFGDGLKLIVPEISADDPFLTKFMSVIIPFTIIFFLLMQAKKIAIEFSGEMGKMVDKLGGKLGAIAMVGGGLALGAVSGGASVAMRGTLGRAGSAISNSNLVKGWEKKGGWLGAVGGTLGKAGGAAAKGSWDLRNAKVAGVGLAGVASAVGLSKVGTGLAKAGSVKTGGFEKMKSDKIEKRVKRAKDLEMGEGSKEKREASDLESKLRTEKANKATELASIEKAITAARQDMEDAAKADPTGTLAKMHFTKLQDAKAKKMEIEKGITLTATDKMALATGTKTGADFKAAANSIADYQNKLNDINDKINAAEIRSINEYAKNIESTGNKALNFFTSFGQHSGASANIAADRIRKGVKIESTKT